MLEQKFLKLRAAVLDYSKVKIKLTEQRAVPVLYIREKQNTFNEFSIVYSSLLQRLITSLVEAQVVSNLKILNNIFLIDFFMI